MDSKKALMPKHQLVCPAGSLDGCHLALIEAVCSDRRVFAGEEHLVDARLDRSRVMEVHGAVIAYVGWRSARRLFLAGHRGFETVVAIYDVWTSNSHRERSRSGDVTMRGCAWPARTYQAGTSRKPMAVLDFARSPIYAWSAEMPGRHRFLS
jgi:hypothetical protein